jgi:hypothetical protein
VKAHEKNQLKTPLALAFVVAMLAATTASCSGSGGHGRVTGVLNAPDCWSGKFDLEPDFFAGAPYRSSLTLRIQRGSDNETFSDGISILIDDTSIIRPSDGVVGEYGQSLAVDIPAGVTPPGVPLAANATPAPVHFVLSLQKSCQTENVALYAVAQVTLPTDDTCTITEDIDGADTASGCAKAAPAGAGTGKSTISFESLFDGDPTESNAAARLNSGCFDVYLADPRDVDPGGKGPPPKCLGHLRGNFDFYFERGRPQQPFP